MTALIAAVLSLAACSPDATSAQANGKSSSTTSAASPAAGRWLVTASHFVSASEGWVLAGSTADRGLRTIFYTADGGLHWSAQLSWTGNAVFGRDGLLGFDLIFVDSRHGFVMDRNSGQGPLLMRTTDGGGTWQALSLPGTPGPGSPLSFVDPNDGWLLADVGAAMGQSSATVYRTLDGGEHWSTVAHVNYGGSSHGLDSSGDKDSLVFRNTFVGWLTAYGGPVENLPPVIWLTQDGGRNWTRQQLTVPAHPASTWNPSPYAPAFFNQSYGVFPVLGELSPLPTGMPTDVPAAGYPTALYVYPTADGGLMWQAAIKLPPTVTGVPLHWEFLDAEHWWITTNGTLWTTADGGGTWSMATMNLPSGYEVARLDFVSPMNGYAVATQGLPSGDFAVASKLLKTSDGGVHWLVSSIPVLQAHGLPSLCGSWSAVPGPLNSAIAPRYGEIWGCESMDATGSAWVLSTAALPAQNSYGVIGVYHCKTNACHDGNSDHPMAGWHFYPGPSPGAVEILARTSSTILRVQVLGQEQLFDITTGTYSLP